MSIFGPWRSEEWDFEFGDLARYNSEVARGIMHSTDWKMRMAEKQSEFNARQAALQSSPMKEEP